MPVIQSGLYELLGQKAGEDNPDAQFWRWVANQKQGNIVDGRWGPPSVKVEFIVIGYRAKAVAKHFGG